MGTRMSLETRRELLEQLKERYRWANRTERSRILNDFTASTDYARKHAIVLLNGSRAVPTAQPSRKRKYDEQVRQALTRIDHRFGNEGDFGRPERFSESFAIDPVQVE